jgi:cytochrome c556
MLRWLVAGVIVSLLSVVFFTNSRIALAQEDAIEDIMKKLHKGGKAVHKGIEKDLEEKDVPWADVQKLSKDYVELTSKLPKTTPEKGEKDSWMKLTKSYNEAAKSLETAANKKDLKAANDAFGNLADSCKACHKAHR